MFGRIGAPEIILILVVVVLLFGAKKLPDMARSLGKSARILKSEAKAMKSEGSQQQEAPSDPPNPGAQQATRTIQASPGDVSSARPAETDHTAQR
ncbi:sec-independent protein translocase protein TatA [Streptomyces sp. 2224.1]|uniref:Sec-independent protein translocase subunit TatA n=1 Tax=unclassified Streptomyces TaxID=2593676 RepID=UPI00087EFEE9|nr:MULTISPECIES: Sec-independent protein translocase subunit TatA [unclassified Streptomyces]PBC81450.1 sec-independent protein translocase protein TatA [Streptomyces sp. 2321.6]SDR54973.1 sec-independent protein translocase protein TatA [Streptomyces sp. KS_16]SEC15738.1 sec-independent protein translocase protein TatA [Streptomyces sp. 2133.1]SED15596.1 sec-independent protein translocase protein TatA [Streptomyces sp. 2224.1]SEF07769.1 sec-independent protein translocase protein TatA [Strep